MKKAVTALGIILFLASATALAEVSCICPSERCTCFIQFGDEGMAVQRIEELLIEQGYLAYSDRASVFGNAMFQAVLRLQQAYSLPETGLMDDTTLTVLLFGISPDELSVSDPFSVGEPVWIPTDGGKRHHRKPSCSGMLDPRLVSQRNALAMDMLPCGRCKPDGFNTILIP